MIQRAIVTTLEDDEGPYFVLPDGFGFGPDQDLIIEEVGKLLYITLEENRAARHKYRAAHGLPPGE